MNSNMTKAENFDYLHLAYHFTVPLKVNILFGLKVKVFTCYLAAPKSALGC